MVHPGTTPLNLNLLAFVALIQLQLESTVNETNEYKSAQHIWWRTDSQQLEERVRDVGI
jgi:hypothetical protein